MGWIGRWYYGTTRQERLAKMTEVYNWEDERKKVETIDAVLVGTTAYLAVKVTNKATGESHVSASVVLSRLEGRELMTKEIGEECGPCEKGCPRHILDKLTPTESQWANEWRKACRERLENKKQDHNVIPRTFSKLTGEILVKTNANEKPGTPATVYKTAWGYSLVNDETGNRYSCPVSMLRNMKLFKVNQIFT